MTKKKKGIIKMTPMKVHYYRSIISFNKYDNIVEQILQEKMKEAENGMENQGFPPICIVKDMMRYLKK